MSSSFDIKCTVEGTAPDNLTHECGVTKNLTWTGNGTHPGLSFYLIRSQLTELSPRYAYAKPKATKIIKFAFTPISPNIGSSKVKVRVKYNIDGVLTTREVYDLGTISSTIYKFHELMVDLDIKNDAFIILDVITSDGTNGAISVTIDCAPSILSAEFCYGFTNSNQYCNLCPQTITFYREKSPGTNATGLINNNSTSFTDFTKGPWFLDKELSIEVGENTPYQFKNEIGVVGTSVYTYSNHNFVLQSICDATTIGCSYLESKTHYLNVNPTEFKYQNPYLPGTPNIKLDGLRYSVKDTIVELDSKHQLVEVRFSWTGGTANRVAYQVTDGNYQNSVGNISENTSITADVFYPSDNSTLFEVKDKATYYTRYFITTTGKLKIRAIVGLKNGTISNYQNTITRIIVGDTNGVCGYPIYSYDMDVHPYSAYDAANSPKVKTRVYSLTEISSWTTATKIYNDPLLVTMALPYYYYNSTTDKVYKVGDADLHREYGTKTRYKVTNSFWNGSTTSTEVLGPTDWKAVFQFGGIVITKVPACIDVLIPPVGRIYSIKLKSELQQPSMYSYLLGYDTFYKVNSNDNYFTTYNFSNETWKGITGQEHALGRLLRGYIMSTKDKGLNDEMENNRIFGPGVLGRASGVFVTGFLTFITIFSFTFGWPLGVALVIGEILIDLFFNGGGRISDLFSVFATKTKIYEENCKLLSVTYSTTPYLINNTSSIYSRIDGTSLSNDGYYCDGFYFYQTSGGLIQLKELAYSMGGGSKKMSIPIVHTETNTQDYITDFDKLMYLTYTAGRPVKYNTTTYTNTSLSSVTVTQPQKVVGELNNPLPITYEIGEGRVIAFSQAEADNQAQSLLSNITSTFNGKPSWEPKHGKDEVSASFTHQIKDEDTPNILVINYNNDDNLGITIGKKLYYDVDGFYTLLNGYYSVSPGSYKKVYKVEYGYVTDIMVWENENDTTVSSVTTGTHSVVTTNKDYTSQWLVGSHIYNEVVFDFGNDDNGLEENWNTPAFYTGSTVYRAMVKGEVVKDSILVFDDNNLSTTTYSEASSKLYRQMYPFISEVETYYTPHTFTIKSEEICDLDNNDNGVKFTVYDSDNHIVNSYVGVTFVANFYSGSSVLFATETVTIAPDSTETFIQLSIPYTGHTVTSVNIASYESPNPYNKITFVQGSHTQSDGVVPCDYYTGVTYQVISFGYVQYTDYNGDIIFTNQTEGIYTIDDIVEYETVFGSLDENYLPSANIVILEHGGCTTSPKPTNITLSNSSIDEFTATGTTIGTFSTTSATPSETYVYTLVSGTGSSDNTSFGLTTGGTLTNLVIPNYDLKTSYSIRVRSTDYLGGYYEKSFTITVNDVNRAPYGLTLSNTSQSENTSTNTVIGELIGFDYDANDTLTVTLFDTDNYPDNNSFNISHTLDEFDVDHYFLRNSSVFNYEVKNSYTIKVKVTDSGGLYYATTFTITIGNVNEQPTGLFLSNSSVYENVPTGTTVGVLSTADEDTADSYSYIFNHIPGTEDDNDYFYIDGNTLKTNAIFDYETQSTYDVRIRAYADGGGYTFTKNFTIDITNVYVNVTASATSDHNGYNVTCHGGSDGVITADTPSGNGTTPYTYSIDGSSYQSSKTFSGLSAGTYTVYAKESNGEVGTTSVTVTQPDALGLSVTNVTVNTCFNDNNGSFTLVGSGGVSPYTYSLDGTNYSSTAIFQNKASQTYYGYVKDSSNCTYGPITISNLVISHPSATVNTTGNTCNGGTYGYIRVSNPTLGAGSPYMIKLTNGGGTVISNYQTYSTAITYSGLVADSYYVYVKDKNGCEFAVSTAITEPTAVTASFSLVTKPTCYSGSTGSYRATASGGNGTYSYRNGGSGTWTAFTGNYVDFTSKSSGTYYIQFKDSNNCVSTVESVDLNVAEPNGTIEITGVTCNGGSTGAIKVSALTGNIGSYSVKLMLGGTTIDTYRTVTTNKTYTDLVAGTYLVYIKDGNNCEKSYGAEVTQPSAVSSTLSLTPPTCVGDTNGSIVVSASGGSAPYTYSKDGTTFQSSDTFSNLGNGTYTITTKDSRGCTVNNTNALNRTDPNADITVNDALCYGGNGTIDVSNGTGGSGSGYSASTDNSTYYALPKTFILGVGTYTIYIKDSSSCVKSYGSKVIGQPAEVTSTISNVTVPTCYNSSNGQFTINMASGVKPYAYRVNGGAYVTLGNTASAVTITGKTQGSYTVDVRDDNGCYATQKSVDLSRTIVSGNYTVNDVQCAGGGDGSIVVNSGSGGTGSGYQTSIDGTNWYTLPKTFSSLSAQEYSLRIKDSNGCTRTYTVAINEPTLLSCTATGTKPTCYNGTNGSITASGSGGTSPYTYSIDGGATYQSSTSFTNLSNNYYTIKVKDSHNCTADSSTVDLNRTAPLADIVGTNVTCNGGGDGSITISNPRGGQGTYSVSIDNSTYYATFPYTFSSLGVSTYTIYIRDREGCTQSYSVVISQPDAVTFTKSPSDPSCWNLTDGQIYFTASGGNGSYQYTVNNSTYVNTRTVTGLGPGTYVTRVRDTNGCYSTTQTVTLTGIVPNANIVATNVTCNGGSNGTITTSGQGTTSTFFRYNSGGYFYNDSGTRYNVGTSYSNLMILSAGDYTFRVYNFNETCYKDYTVTITQPTSQTASITNVSAETITGSDGSLTITSTGGVWNKTYRLYDNQ
jgi:hypothetical protein